MSAAQLFHCQTSSTRRGVLPTGALALIGLIVLLCGCAHAMEAPGVIYRDASGRALTRADLPTRGAPASKNIAWWDGTVPPEAEGLLGRAREAEADGDFEAALDLIAQAREAAPDWPAPTYAAAYLSVRMGDNAKAEEHFRAVLQKAPRGFEWTDTALDSLRREREGVIPEGSYRRFMLLVSRNNVAQKNDSLMALLEESPAFPAVWAELALARNRMLMTLDRIEIGLSYNPDRDTKAILLINKALVPAAERRQGEAIQILGDIILDPSSTVWAEALAKDALVATLER
jgi:tetratricopeptide (TPR) repeat protein